MTSRLQMYTTVRFQQLEKPIPYCQLSTAPHLNYQTEKATGLIFVKKQETKNKYN